MHLISWLAGPRGSIPEDQIVYAIGDIHGRDDLLSRLHDTIQQDLDEKAQGRRGLVIYLGDYVDRGPDSKAVIDRLLDRPVRGADQVFLKGNHEDAMLRFLDGETGGGDWLQFGGGATAKSYGVSLKGPDNRALDPDVTRGALGTALPGRHLSFLRGLALRHEVGDYFFVHAGIRPGCPLDQQSPADLLWIRSAFLRSRRRHGKIIVHGHASGRDVVVKSNRICVDTMAYATDCLSCVVLEGASHRFLRAEI
ncbi:MAG: metallophosphoesterase family protein [Kiloniellaceae bacterium]